MRYFRLLDDMSVRMRNRWHIGELLAPDGREIALRDGARFDDTIALHAEVHHVGYVLDFCNTTFGIPIATRELAAAIADIAGSDVQCIPVAISGQTGRFILHALHIVRCVDEHRSCFERFMDNDPVRPDLAGQYQSVTKLVLDRSAIPTDAHFFRIKDWEVALIVSEKIKVMMERVGCFGAEFTEIELA